MNRAPLIFALLISLNVAAQVESGTIRVRKSKSESDEYMKFMREIPTRRGWFCGGVICYGVVHTDRTLSVVLGAGHGQEGYFDMGIISGTPLKPLLAGTVLSVTPKTGSSLSPFAQWTLWEGKKGFRILSLGLRGFLPLDGLARNGIQPYLAWSIPTRMLRRFQVNTGYEFRSGPKPEAGEALNALNLGLWFFL